MRTKLYNYADTIDTIILLASAVLAIVGGALKPFMTVIFGQVAISIKDYTNNSSVSSTFTTEIGQRTLYLVYLGIGQFFAVFFSTAGFIYAGEHITHTIREQYLAALLRQNIAFFDELGTSELSNALTYNTNLIQDAISQNVPLTLAGLAAFVSAFIISFIKSWKLALILSSTVIVVLSINLFSAPKILEFRKKAAETYNASSSVAEEGISSMRDMTASGSQEKVALQYEVLLRESTRWGFKAKITQGVVMALMICAVYLNYGLAFWMGSRYIVSGDVALGDALTILLAMMVCASLGEVAPHAQAFSAGVAAAGPIFGLIARVPAIGDSHSKGFEPVVAKGEIEMREVRHVYPCRPDILVLDDLNLVFPAGKTTALVGTSGSGKSTIFRLIERFYDLISGQIFLDGVDISEMSLTHLRKHISVVSQDPILFNQTIFENIEQGLVNSYRERLDLKIKTELIEKAAKLANAHEFIQSLPQGYQTQVGQHGQLLSGGQKQRIAIARAVVNEPLILLLDEPTSALDSESEKMVQAALEQASVGRTTIIVTHRLSTIARAENIVVLENGKVIEQGNHHQLMANAAGYYSSLQSQNIKSNRNNLWEPKSSLVADPDPNASPEHQGFKQVELLEKGTAMVAEEAIPRKEPSKFSSPDLIRFIGSFNKSDALLMGTGLLCSILTGLGNPIQSIFFSKLIVALSIPSDQYDVLRQSSNFWSLMYLMLAIVQFISFCGQGFAFGLCSERLIYRSRSQSYRHMLRQSVDFFDAKGNSVAALMAFLATQTTGLAGLSGTTLGTMLSLMSTLLGAITLSLVVAWKLALVCTATVPVLLFGGFLRVRMLSVFQQNSRKMYEESASLALEAIAAIRTVASLTIEPIISHRFRNSLEEQRAKSLPSILKSSCLYALSQSVSYLCLALGFWYGSQLIARNEYNMLQFYIVFMAIMFGVQSAGAFFAFAPDIGKAKHAAQELKSLFERRPFIDVWSDEGRVLETVRGDIELQDVQFSYAQRPEVSVLNHLNLSAKAGSYIALVGPSGCGKSTIIALLERFYDPTGGRVLLDGHDISELNVRDYRSHIALVSQEPTLYQGTIRDNILFGAGGSDVSEETFVKSCNDAALNDFVMSLPEGYNTIVGPKGVLLSGGQRQRIAIARALIRQPRILLLDEATSALDSGTEESVQKALDAAARGRTTIAVTHHLSTIKNADIIYVLDKGRVVEHGTYNQL